MVGLESRLVDVKSMCDQSALQRRNPKITPRRACPTNLDVYLQPPQGLEENAFGSSKPHPDEVLRLFLEQNVMFALPFATDRASQFLCVLTL